MCVSRSVIPCLKALSSACLSATYFALVYCLQLPASKKDLKQLVNEHILVKV